VEARIRDIEHKLSHAEIIDVTTLNAGGRVVFGATVELFCATEETELRYQIVGEEEADIRVGRISISSPIARALIGKSEGDEITVRAPAGDRVYEVLRVLYL
jgi:transcription elongation factor GreA